jgi:hypothetical protein
MLRPLMLQPGAAADRLASMLRWVVQEALPRQMALPRAGQADCRPRAGLTDW